MRKRISELIMIHAKILKARRISNILGLFAYREFKNRAHVLVVGQDNILSYTIAFSAYFHFLGIMRIRK